MLAHISDIARAIFLLISSGKTCGCETKLGDKALDRVPTYSHESLSPSHRAVPAAFAIPTNSFWPGRMLALAIPNFLFNAGYSSRDTLRLAVFLFQRSPSLAGTAPCLAVLDAFLEFDPLISARHFAGPFDRLAFVTPQVGVVHSGLPTAGEPYCDICQESPFHQYRVQL